MSQEPKVSARLSTNQRVLIQLIKSASEDRDSIRRKKRKLQNVLMDAIRR